jgi:hypothetical protein
MIMGNPTQSKAELLGQRLPSERTLENLPKIKTTKANIFLLRL